MKHSFKLAAFALLLFSMPSRAQVSFGLTLGGAVPMGAFGAAPTYDAANLNVVGTASGGGGLGLHFRYHFTENFAAGINTSILYLAGQNIVTPSQSVEGGFIVFPLMLAADYYFMTEELKPYAGLELGFISTNAAYLPRSGNAIASQGGFAFAPTAGIRWDFAEHFGLLANVKYMIGLNEHKYDNSKNDPSDVGMPATSYLGINVGVNFTFGN